MNKTFRIIVVVFTLIFVVFSTLFGMLAVTYANTWMEKTAIGEAVGTVEGLEDTNPWVVDVMNILLIGVDEGGYRSDTIMLISVDGYSERVSILSIPRDTRVKPEGYTAQKINALMGLGQEAVKKGKMEEPEELLINMIKDITGLDIHYFMTVDFEGFKDIIDALGGVDFNVPYDMNYDDPTQNLHIHLEAGQQHLDGQAAHDFVRFRHNNNGSAPGEYVTGDEGRQHWQQKFLKELIRQKCQPQYIEKVDEIFEVVAQNVRTNYTLNDLFAHLDFIENLDVERIGSYQLPGEAKYIGDVSWYIYDREDTRALIEDIFLPKDMNDWEEYKAKNPDTGKQNFVESMN